VAWPGECVGMAHGWAQEGSRQRFEISSSRPGKNPDGVVGEVASQTPSATLVQLTAANA
jgi:hypothetical protein